ncbi:hypothetical protein ACFVVP_26635 [Streptomyces sp. NPDC058128]|uniref:hypothetical protein n=1 Tax=Streptomyces sp. NPDC058128 TaxID=3346352 RepID=UPI0036E8C4DB
MVSAQILVGSDGTETVLGGGGLQLVDRRARTEIPLAVVQKARTSGGNQAEIVLTDGAVHRVDGGNPTAVAAFVSALTAALPERRDPAGSARVTVTPLTPPAEPETTKNPFDKVRATLLAIFIAYVGNAIGVGVAYEAGAIIFPLFAVIPFFFGAALQFAAVQKTGVYRALKERGITVPAHFAHRNKNGVPVYRFTGADGVEHLAQGSSTLGPETRVVYDPESPLDYSFELSARSTALSAFFHTFFGLPLLVGGAALAVLPYFLD